MNNPHLSSYSHWHSVTHYTDKGKNRERERETEREREREKERERSRQGLFYNRSLQVNVLMSLLLQLHNVVCS